MSNPITKISNVYDNQTHTVNLGAEGDDVFITLSHNGQNIKVTLNSFAEFLYDYFKNGHFLFYGTGEPQSNNVKIWYDTNQD